MNKKISNIEKELTQVKGELKVLNAKIDHVEDGLSTAIVGLIDRFYDMKERQNKWFTLFGILFTATPIITPVAVALINKFVK